MTRHKLWFYHPRYWLYWIILSIFWLVAKLPYAWLLKLGAGLGELISRLVKRPKHNAKTNLRLCFPALSEQARQQLLQRNFVSVGIGIFELFLSWWASNKRLLPLIDLQGTEYIDKALAAGKGVIIAAPHLTSLELALRLFSIRYPVGVMYHRQKHAWFEHLNQYFLQKYYTHAVARDNVRGLLKALRQNAIICYTPDVDAGIKNSAFVPFFKVPAATLTAMTRFAQLTGATILFAYFYRKEDGTGYEMVIKPPLENFPSDNAVQDAICINQVLEDIIRHKPEQYIWQYKRFKTRPPGEQSFYD
jgi:KDO2-lipid IV(A) lauroyltransferase